MENALSILTRLWETSGFFLMVSDWRQLIMIVIALFLLYLGLVKKFEPLLLIGIETLNDVSVNHVDVEVRRANHVLHLPQVEQIFGDVLFAFLLCNNHDVPWVVYPNLLMFRSMVSFTILMRRPSTVRMRSWTNDDSVRMALDVVMFERLAMSSRAM